ncbi:MAG TPA: hypothetical protein VGJ05_09420 [Fimbriiglobus sp.]|jgi:hypothetical protein
MATVVELDRDRTRQAYDRAADRYLQSLPLEHFMESTDQSTQRAITVESLELNRVRAESWSFLPVGFGLVYGGF